MSDFSICKMNIHYDEICLICHKEYIVPQIIRKRCLSAGSIEAVSETRVSGRKTYLTMTRTLVEE